MNNKITRFEQVETPRVTVVESKSGNRTFVIMARTTRSSSRTQQNNNGNDGENLVPPQDAPQQQQPPAGAGEGGEEGNGEGRSVAAHIRNRQRAVAEREASRLARPEQRIRKRLQHADRTKSAVTSTPFGIHKATQVSPEDGDYDNEEEWCGPWSVARQMIAKREEAKRKRQEELEESNREHHPLDELMDQVHLEQQKRLHPSMTWKAQIPASTPTSIYAKRQRRMQPKLASRTIPTLFQLCVDFVVANFDYVESLGDVDNDVRVSISKELVARNKLDAQALETLCEPTLEILELIDCAGIPQTNMADALKDMPSLKYLLLTHAGRCFGPLSVEALVTTRAPLCCLSISGAYLLTDADAATLIRTNAATLQSLDFQVCPLLKGQFATAISELKAGTLLELSLQELTLDGPTLETLASASSQALSGLTTLQLPSMPSLNDAILTKFLQTTGESLETLNVSNNHELTDGSLSAIRQFASTRLKRLNISGLKELTSVGLETLFTFDLPGLPPPPKLKVWNVGSCHYQAVTDDVLELVTASSSASCHKNNPATSDAPGPYRGVSGTIGNGNGNGGGRAGGLVFLDIQGSTLVTDVALEQLAATSAMTLQELNVSYCPWITDKGLGYLVSQVGKQLSKIQCWGCAQLTDDFFDGHARVHDRSLEIVGAWIKKSGTRSLR